MKKICRLSLIIAAFTSAWLLPEMVYAASGSAPSIKALFSNVSESLSSVANLILSMAMIAGLGFGVASIFKFKQHKDNPQQVPIGMPLALLGIAVMLIWLPFLLQSLGGTVTGGAGGNKDYKSGIRTGSQAPTWIGS